jgi:hypothetical protein
LERFDVLAYAGRGQGMGASLAAGERRLREVRMQIGQAALQLHADRDQRQG